MEIKGITKENVMEILNSCYQTSINGINKVFPPVETMANNYLDKHFYPENAAKEMIKYQLTKCTTAGFLAGLGGVATLPITIPANISSVLIVQLRMIACLAYMAGFNVHDDQTQTLVYASLAGVSVGEITKKFGVEFGKKLAVEGIKKIPVETIRRVNRFIGFRLLTKFGETGLINIGKMVPVVGGVITGGFDYTETKLIANRAYKTFIKELRS